LTLIKIEIKLLGSGDRDVVESCLFEQGLGDILVRNKERIEFTSDYSDVINYLDIVDAIFMCVNTPELEGETGEANLTYYNLAAEKIAEALSKRDGGAPGKIYCDS